MRKKTTSSARKKKNSNIGLAINLICIVAGLLFAMYSFGYSNGKKAGIAKAVKVFEKPFFKQTPEDTIDHIFCDRHGCRTVSKAEADKKRKEIAAYQPWRF